MTLVFGLFSALLALVAMRILGTPELDASAYLIGLVAAGVLGAGVTKALHVMRSVPRLRGLSWMIVPLAGSAVGMLVQAILCAHRPLERPILLSTGLSTDEPILWVLAGVPLGGIPALFAAAVLALSIRVVAPTGTHDARERMTVPFAGACALLASCALGAAKSFEIPALLVVLALAVGALVQVLLADRARQRWLSNVFVGVDPAFEVVPIAECPTADVPAAVGAVFPRSVILRVEPEASYRGAARTPHASTGATLYEAVEPLVRRRLMLLLLLASTGAAASIVLVVRAAST